MGIKKFERENWKICNGNEGKLDMIQCINFYIASAIILFQVKALGLVLNKNDASKSKYGFLYLTHHIIVESMMQRFKKNKNELYIMLTGKTKNIFNLANWYCITINENNCEMFCNYSLAYDRTSK